MKFVLPNLQKNRQKFTCFTVKNNQNFQKNKNFDKNTFKIAKN